MPRRNRARQIVVEILYQDDLNPDVDPIDDGYLLRRLGNHEDLIAFAHSLITGVRAHREELDRRIEETAEHWALPRMAAMDRNLLRLGVYEMLHTDTDDVVVINEAVELAKRFGAPQSPKFINGILDRFVKKGIGDRG